MAEGLLAALRHDAQAALAAGRERGAGYPRDGGAWLAAFATLCVLTGLGLLLTGGYHAGFFVVNGAAPQLPAWFWQGLTILGDERTAFALSLFVARRHPQILWSLVLAALLATAYSNGFKELFDTLRPPAELPDGAFQLIGPEHRRTAFPSGHSVTAAVFFGVLAYYGRAWPSRVIWLTLAAAAGLSRVAIGVHWPVDVAAGLFGGALAAWLGIRWSAWASWGIRDLSVHLAFVALAGIMAVALLLWDGDYHLAAPLQQGIGLASLGFALLVYLGLPAWRWVIGRVRS